MYRIIPDPSTMFLELKAGKLDMMSLSPQQYLRQTQGPQWERDWRKYRYLSFSYTFLGFNLEHPFFKDVRVRRAISMVIDRQSLIDGVLLGQGVPTVGPYKPGTWAYNDKLTPVRQDVDEAIQQSLTWRQFLNALECNGYEVRMGRKYPVLRPPGKERFVRFKTLGKRYTPEAIRTRILIHNLTAASWKTSARQIMGGCTAVNPAAS